MKKALLGVCLVALLGGCASHTEYGDCVGLGEDQDPKLVYKVSVRNLAVGLFFIETVIVPVYVTVDQFYCPVGVK